MAFASCIGRRVVAAIPVAALALLIMAACQPAEALAEAASQGSSSQLVSVKAPPASGTAAASSAGPDSQSATKLAKVGEDTFSYTLDANGKAVIVGYEGTSAKLAVPATVDGVAVAGLGSRPSRRTRASSSVRKGLLAWQWTWRSVGSDATRGDSWPTR